MQIKPFCIHIVKHLLDYRQYNLMELGHDILWSLILKNNKQNVSTAVKCVHFLNINFREFT